MWTRITPNQVTWSALVLGLGAAACFAAGGSGGSGGWGWLVLGAVLYHFSFVLDCMDGKLARLTGTGSLFGEWLDFVFDRVRILVCAVALMGGQYARTGQPVYLWLALAVVFLDMLRYVDALQSARIRDGMRKQLLARLTEARQLDDEPRAAFMEELLRRYPEAGGDAAGQEPPGRGTAGGRPASLAGRVRALLQRHRIRVHLISGIEFQMGVFIVAPLAGAVVPVTIASGALLLLFELVVVRRLLMATRDFARRIDSFGSGSGSGPGPGPGSGTTPAMGAGLDAEITAGTDADDGAAAGPRAATAV